MIDVPITHVLLLAVALFALGLTGVLIRRNALFMLLGVEIMLNAGGLAFVAAGAGRAAPDGQVMFIFTLAMAAAEAAVGLALILRLGSGAGSLDTDAAHSLRG